MFPELPARALASAGPASMGTRLSEGAGRNAAGREDGCRAHEHLLYRTRLRPQTGFAELRT